MQLGALGLGRMGTNIARRLMREVWRRGGVVSSWLLDLTARRSART